MIDLKDEISRKVIFENIALSLQGQKAFLRRFESIDNRQVDMFLNHVISTVPYYQNLIHSNCAPTLDDFPLIDRPTMRDRRDEFISNTYREDCKPFFASTDGTISQPLKVSFDLASFYEFNCFSFAQIFQTKPHIMNMLQPEKPCIYFVTHVLNQQRTTVFNPAIGGTLLRRLPMYRDLENDRQIVRYLRQRRIPVLYGRPHVLLHLLDLDDREYPTHERIRPYSLLAMGENLYDSDRATLTNWYGCQIINAYTATEAGLIAVDCQHGNGLHVQSKRVLVEVLESGGRIVPQGTGEFVITNLANWCHAFVRYRLGDHGTLRRYRCECGFEGPTITRLSGRDEEYLDAKGKGVIASLDLEKVLTRPEIRQYEVAQDGEGFLTIRWMSVPNTDSKAVVHDLNIKLSAILGSSYQLVHADQITAQGGKLRRFIKAP